MKKLLFIFIFLPFTEHKALSQSLPTISNDGIALINSYLKGQTNRKHIPGIVAMVANRKEIIYKGAFGINSIASKTTLKINDLFDIASMTKAVTAVAVMQLYEQGKLKLDDNITKYLPELSKLRVIEKFNNTDTSFSTVPLEKPITIGNLLTHTSGVGYVFSNKILAAINKKNYKGEFTTAYMDFPLLHQPGAKWTYGLSYDILGVMIEKITGVGLDKYFEEHIFKPLGMNNTSFNVGDENFNRLTNFYIRMNDSLVEQQSFGKRKATPGGGGGLYTTAEDYTTFLQMLLNGGTFKGNKLLSQKSVREMTGNQIGNLFVEKQDGAMPILSKDFPLRVDKDKFGYGFVITTNIDNDGLNRKPGSYNWAGLFNTHYWVDPQTGITAVILMQVLPFYDKSCIETLTGFETLIYKDLNNHK